MKVLVTCALLSILVLAFNCGPFCEIEAGTSQSSPCHQEQNRDSGPVCDWDLVSIKKDMEDSRSIFSFPLQILEHYRISLVDQELSVLFTLEKEPLNISGSETLSHLSFIRILI
ncbi:hypothetical protein EHQ64_19985 [Leptospira sarikeiensis]|uniref:Lipoprotein n=1 Tax=Leptospira sarikeiensis TaxID=2484943 RepID=A0A4R9JYQ5_9LEPT|nr:hypothetical protein EHQ64_19985 [Leptospira sarikeiensis]